MVLLRFAPSPTGSLHLGGLRTALYNYLYARKTGGKWIMRIEDTDTSRTVPGSVDEIRRSLEWAGLDYDYGPHKEGPHGPYFQSERLDLYHTYVHKLLDSGHAYRCFCSSDTLLEKKQKLARSGSTLSYDRTCRYLTDEEVHRKMRAKEKFVVRFDESQPISRPSAQDLIFGQIRDTGHRSNATDPIILKTDNFPTYHLASVVDDHEMGITHVLRGEEWLPSLPLHLNLNAALKLTPPQFAHLPVLLNHDGTKMSKRKGDGHLANFVRAGWEREGLLNWIALAGWGAQHHTTAPETSPQASSLLRNNGAPDSTAIMTLPQMVEAFDISALTQRSSGLDPSKLEYINKHHIVLSASTPTGLEGLAQKIHSLVKETFPASPHTSIQNIKAAIVALDGRLTNIFDITTHASYFFVEPDLSTDEAQAMLKKIPAEQNALVAEAVIQLLHDNPAPTIDVLNQERDKLGVTGRSFMTVLRRALAGVKDGPTVVDLIRALGPSRVIARLERAI